MTAAVDVPESLLADAFSAAELQHMTFDPLVEYVTGLVTEGFGILSGGPKLGNSWLMMNIGLAIPAGGLVLGKIRVQQRDILYLAMASVACSPASSG